MLQVQRRSRVSRSEGKIAPLKFPFFISVCHNGSHLTNLTIKPTVTRLHPREPTNPEPPQETPKMMHVVNRKQIHKRPYWSVLFLQSILQVSQYAQPADSRPPQLGETKPKQHTNQSNTRTNKPAAEKPRQRASAKQKVAVTNWLWCCPECEERL